MQYITAYSTSGMAAVTNRAMLTAYQTMPLIPANRYMLNTSGIFKTILSTHTYTCTSLTTTVQVKEFSLKQKAEIQTSVVRGDV